MKSNVSARAQKANAASGSRQRPLQGLYQRKLPGIPNKKSGSPHVRRHKTSPCGKKSSFQEPPPPQDIPARKQKSLPVQGGVKTNEGKKKARRLPTFPPREAVSSALESLTSVFGMGTGISSPLWPPDNVYKSSFCPPACGSRRRGRTLFYAKGLLRKARLPAESTIWSSLTTY